MKKILVLLFFSLFFKNVNADIIEFKRCYVKDDDRSYLEKVRLDYIEDRRMPRKSFNNKIYEYHNYFIDLNANHFWNEYRFTKKFYDKAKKEAEAAGRSGDFKRTRKTPYRKITKIDEENGIIVSSKKWKDTFFYNSGEITRKEWSEKIKAKDIRWGDTYVRRTINLQKGTVQYYVNELEGYWKYILQCETPYNPATQQFLPNELIVMGSGSGFLISREGYLVTNYHVIGNCKFVSIEFEGNEYQADVVETDKINDLAILKGSFKNKNFLKIKDSGAVLGEDILVLGYPLSSSLSDSVKITKGVVSSLSGINNDNNMIQIDAAIQPGNSGGPVLNMSGLVVGVASSGLDASQFFENKGYIPQNVNFAISTNTLSDFLKTNKIKFESSSLEDYANYSTKKIASIGEPNTVRLFCINTASEYTKIKSSKKFTNILKDGGSIRRYKKSKLINKTKKE